MDQLEGLLDTQYILRKQLQMPKQLIERIYEQVALLVAFFVQVDLREGLVEQEVQREDESEGIPLAQFAAILHRIEGELNGLDGQLIGLVML